jgi:hypothetical protein
MKYIKSYKVFESKEDIVSDVENILVDLVDDENRISVDYIKLKNTILEVDIFFNNFSNDGVDISKYEYNINQLLSYLEGEGFEFYSLFVDSDQDNYEIVCPECKSLDIEYGEEDLYKNGAIMNTCNVCGHKAPEDDFEFNKTKKDYDTIEEVKEFFTKPNGYEINSVTFKFVKK